MSSWCPLPTIRPTQRATLFAHRHGRNGARAENVDDKVTNHPDLSSYDVDRRTSRAATISAVAGIGAGAIHAAAVGAHADHRVLANVFVILAVTQLGTGIALLRQPGRSSAKAVIVVNAAAVVGWMVSRAVGVWFIAGLEAAEPPEFADTACAALGALAALAAAFALHVDNRLGPTRRWMPAIAVRDVALPAIAVVLLVLPAMSVTTTHAHPVDVDDTHSHGISDDDGDAVDAAQEDG